MFKKPFLKHFLAFFVFFLVGLPAFSASHYMALVDAGSSGSRLHLFEYDAALGLPDLKAIASKEVKPGLSSFATRPEMAGEFLKPLFDEAVLVLNKLSVDPGTVQIHILASAGMRLLPEAQQEKIYDQVKQYLKNNYSFTIGDIKTIDGKEEGLYGWLSVNYLEGTFHRKEPTLGSIDMGGASTQIAFAVSDTTPSADKVTLVINHQPYTVFTKSFLNLGQDRARESMLTQAKALHCYPKLYQIGQNRIGNFMAQECRSLYADILQKHGVKQLVTPPKDMLFVAYSGIYYVYDFFKPNVQQSLEQKILEVCSKEWPELEKIYAGNKYLSTFCANGVYVHELLFHTYELKNERLKVVNKIQRRDVDWTLGALLYRLTQHQIHWDSAVQIHSVTPTEAVFSWRPAVSASSVMYDVEVRGNGGKVYSNVQGNSILVPGLLPDTPYSVVVTAKNAVNRVESTGVPVRTPNYQPHDLQPDWCVVGC